MDSQRKISSYTFSRCARFVGVLLLGVWGFCLSGCWVTFSEFKREQGVREALEKQFRAFKREQREKSGTLQKLVDKVVAQQAGALAQLQLKIQGFREGLARLEKRVKQGQGGVVEMFATLEKLQRNFQQSLGQVQELQQQIRDLLQKSPEQSKQFQELQKKYEALLKNQQLLAEQAIPAKLFAKAEDAYKRKEYSQALPLFRAFTQRFGTHELADNAYYHIGEIHQKNNRMSDAILAYDVVIRKYPQGSSVPIALLRLGQLHYKQGLCTDGRKYFRQLSNYRRHAPDLARLGRDLYRNWRRRCRGSRTRSRTRRPRRRRRRSVDD